MIVIKIKACGIIVIYEPVSAVVIIEDNQINSNNVGGMMVLKAFSAHVLHTYIFFSIRLDNHIFTSLL